MLPLSAAALALLAGAAHAQQGGKPPEPPAEAYAACSGRSAGDQVSFTANGHTIEGTCEKIGDRLALRPSRRPPPNGRPPSSDSGGTQ
ncbi:hypothetical protein [Solimonas soli]|uniref:hypothetical protein n=1 Tax=Solimonas soli TaxID=413479 RepID=UPI0004AF13E5|nr:hypothetical protein [Solimonas soli]